MTHCPLPPMHDSLTEKGNACCFSAPMRVLYDDDDDDDYTFPIQGSGVCIDQRQYKVPPLCPVLGVLSPWEENPSQVQTVR